MSITNAEIAQKVTDLLTKWSNREDEMTAWLGGSATGGVGSDGVYPLTDVAGTVRNTKCPARLEADVTGLVNSASSYASQAQAAKTDALAAQTSASGYATQAQVARDAAINARDVAISNRNDAQGYAAALATIAERILLGSGSPEGSISSSPGKLYLSSDGACYIKKTGTGNTGWRRLTDEAP